MGYQKPPGTARDRGTLGFVLDRKGGVKVEQEDLSTFKPSSKMQFCEHRKARVLQYFSSVLLNGNPLQHAHCSIKIFGVQRLFKKSSYCSYVVSENSRHGEAKSHQEYLVSLLPVCCHFLDHFFHSLPALDRISSSLGVYHKKLKSHDSPRNNCEKFPPSPQWVH